MKLSTPGGTSDHEKCCCEIRSSAAEHVLSSWYRPPSQRRKRRHLVPIRATDITTVFFDLCSVRRRRALEGSFADARGHSRGGNARPLTTVSRTVAVTHEAPSARRMGDLPAPHFWSPPRRLALHSTICTAGSRRLVAGFGMSGGRDVAEFECGSGGPLSRYRAPGRERGQREHRAATVNGGRRALYCSSFFYHNI